VLGISSAARCTSASARRLAAVPHDALHFDDGFSSRPARSRTARGPSGGEQVDDVFSPTTPLRWRFLSTTGTDVRRGTA